MDCSQCRQRLCDCKSNAVSLGDRGGNGEHQHDEGLLEGVARQRGDQWLRVWRRDEHGDVGRVRRCGCVCGHLAPSLERGIRCGCRQFPIEESCVCGGARKSGRAVSSSVLHWGWASLFRGQPRGTARMENRMLTDELRNEPTPEANRYGVGSAARLKLREQVPDV